MTQPITEVALGSIAAIPLGEGRAFLVDGLRIAVFRTRADRLFAVQATCPHRGGPLADGLLGGSFNETSAESATVICPLHSRKYNLATGTNPADDCRLITYAVRVDSEGRILLTQ